MYYVYLIKIKNRAKHHYYISYTSDLKKRIADHQENKGEVNLIYYEAYQTEKLARIREKKLSRPLVESGIGSAWRGLKQRLNLA